jgi:hypothetical protein
MLSAARMSELSWARYANQGRAGRPSGTGDWPRAASGPQWQILLSGPTHISPHVRDTGWSAGGHHRRGARKVFSAGIRRAATLFCILRSSCSRGKRRRRCWPLADNSSNQAADATQLAALGRRAGCGAFRRPIPLAARTLHYGSIRRSRASP